MIPVSEQVFVPIHRVERISMFGEYATIKYVDQREVERVDGEDAKRLFRFCKDNCFPSGEPKEERKQGARR
jgi:hypothetical protein